MTCMCSVNLLPAQLVAAHARRRHVRRWIVVCLAVLAVLSVPVGLEWYRVARAAELDVAYTRLNEERRSVEAELTEVSTTSRETFLQLERARALRSKRSWSGIIALLAATMPEGCWLVELATDPSAPLGQQVRKPAPAPKDAAPDHVIPTVTIEAPRKLRIVGFASNAGEPLAFVSRLKEAAVFTRVDLKRTQREPMADGFYFRFELVCEW